AGPRLPGRTLSAERAHRGLRSGRHRDSGHRLPVHGRSARRAACRAEHLGPAPRRARVLQLASAAGPAHGLGLPHRRGRPRSAGHHPRVRRRHGGPVDPRLHRCRDPHRRRDLHHRRVLPPEQGPPTGQTRRAAGADRPRGGRSRRGGRPARRGSRPVRRGRPARRGRAHRRPRWRIRTEERALTGTQDTRGEMSTVEHETATHSRSASIAASVRSSELLGDLAEASRELDQALFRRLFELSRTPSLLVATDYDGTIAPIVEVPSQAFPLESSVDSLRALALLPSTSAGVISGRSLRDLAAMSRLPREVHLFGSHGGETDTLTIASLDETQRATLADFRADLTRALPGAVIEHKPTGAAVHLRGLDEVERHRIDAAVDALAATHPIHPTRGKQVIDLSVVPSSKAEALTRLRARTGAESVVFIGDDTADEVALETLGDGDLGLKVGQESVPTHADFRLSSPAEVSVVLGALFELRKAWLFGRRATPIQRHSLLGNGQSTA